MTDTLPLHIFAPISDYAIFLAQGGVSIDLYENYQKRSWRNRYAIATAYGMKILSVPLKKGKHEQQKIYDVLISYDEDWVKVHLKTLETAYKNSPFYEYYIPYIEKLFLMHHEKLTVFSTEALYLMIDLMKLDLPVTFSNTYVPNKFCPQVLLSRYLQVFEHKIGFIQNLSILDLLFCQGPESLLCLKKMQISI